MYLCHMNNIEIIELYGKSNKQIATELGAVYKQYRRQLALNRQDIAKQCGVSVLTIARFENGGRTSISLDNFIALLRAVRRLENLSTLIPDLPDSLYRRPQK